MLMQAGEGGDEGAFKELSLSETRQILASEEGRALAMAGIEEDDENARYPDLLQELLSGSRAA